MVYNIYYYVLHRFAFQVAIGGKNTKEKLIQAISDKVKSRYMFPWCQLFLPLPQLQALAEALAVNKTLRSLTLTMGFYEAPGFNGSRAGRAHGLNWVPGPRDGGRNEERSRRRFPIHFDRRKGSRTVLGPQKSVGGRHDG